MMRKMDTGISWFENEVANVIREGRNNPSVPIVVIGVEPDVLFDEEDGNGAEISDFAAVAKIVKDILTES